MRLLVIKARSRVSLLINRNMFTQSLLSTSALLLICLPIDPTSFRLEF